MTKGFFPLSREALDHLALQGSLHLPGFFSTAECQQLVHEAQQVMGDASLMSPRDEEFYARYGADNATFVNQHDHGELLRSLARGPRLTELAGQLFAGGAAFHMSLVQLSEPGRGQGVSWHQDVDPALHAGALYNFLVYPEALTAETGPLVYVPGSHRRGALPPGGHYDEIEGQRALIAGAGDLVIVHATLFHCVPRNRTARRRFSLNFRFRDARVPAAAMTVGVYRNGKFDYATGAPVEASPSPVPSPSPSPVEASPPPHPAGSMARLLEAERAHLPTGMTPGFLAAPRVFSHGRGVKLYDLEGREYLDFSAGTFTNSTGHCHPRVVSFLQERVAELWNIHDYASPYRAPLLRQLDGLTPPQIDTFELYSGGTETIEAGLRALYSSMPEGKKGLCTFRQGFHGKTLGSRSLVGWSMPGEPTQPPAMLDFPNCYRCPFGKQPQSCARECEQQVEQTLEANPQLGAIVFEPILGAGGAVSPPPGYLERLQQRCKERGLLLFVDEICVGFGRTGRDFSLQHYGLEPDLMAFAKGMASGFPAMVLGGRRELMTRPPFGNPGGASTTFGGNPLAVAALHVTLEVYRDEQLCANAAALEPELAARLEELAVRHSTVGQARVRGLFACLDFVKDRTSKEPDDAFGLEVHRRCMALGLKTFAFGHIFRIAPPLTITAAELHAGLDLIDQALCDLSGSAAA
jgi:4-aminobutyrate aminotransferase-like enzyme